MLITEVKDGENIERAIKRYKRKFRNTKLLMELRDNKHYTKKSVKRRKTIQKASYKQYLENQKDK